MPDPGYLGDDSPGCIWLVVGTIAMMVVFFLVRSYL